MFDTKSGFVGDKPTGFSPGILQTWGSLLSPKYLNPYNCFIKWGKIICLPMHDNPLFVDYTGSHNFLHIHIKQALRSFQSKKPKGPPTGFFQKWIDSLWGSCFLMSWGDVFHRCWAQNDQELIEPHRTALQKNTPFGFSYSHNIQLWTHGSSTLW